MAGQLSQSVDLQDCKDKDSGEFPTIKGFGAISVSCRNMSSGWCAVWHDITHSSMSVRTLQVLVCLVVSSYNHIQH